MKTVEQISLLATTKSHVTKALTQYINTGPTQEEKTPAYTYIIIALEPVQSKHKKQEQKALYYSL